MKIVKLRKPSKMEVRAGVERLEPKARGKINITKETDFIFPDDEFRQEFPDELFFPKNTLDDFKDYFKQRMKMRKKVETIGKYEYKPPYEPPSILSATGKDKKVERTGKLVYNAEPTAQDKAVKKYMHYADKYGISLQTKERGKKTIAQLAKEINAYEHNPKNMARILKQPIDAKFKERGLYLIDV
jgi:hypothetical protein